MFSETRRRRVYAAAAFYAATSWLLAQVATLVFPAFDVPGLWVRYLIIALAVLFPFAMLAAWFTAWTPVGYRRSENAAGSSAQPILVASPESGPSIAVLPFADMSEQKDQEYFSDGLAEELLNLLAQLPQLRVVARGSSFSFKGKDADIATIAKTLNVSSVLEGSIRRAGNRLRVTAKLIRGADSAQMWSQTYDRELTDIFEVQDEIAGSVVAALSIKLLPDQALTARNHTQSIEAHDQYLLGQSVFRHGRYDDYRHALRAFERAVSLDPDYAAGYVGLANAWSAVADYAEKFEQRDEQKRAALACAEKAIVLAPDLAAAYVVRGQLRYRLAYDWQGAVADFQRAMALEPNSGDVLLGYALALNNLERIEEAAAIAAKATKADPLSSLPWTVLGYILKRKEDLHAARTALQRALLLSPNSTFARYVLGELDLEEGHPEAALENFRQTSEGYRQAGFAMAKFSLGQAEDSNSALDEVKEKFGAGFSYQIAEAHAWRGEKDAAFDWLERAYAQHDSGLGRLRGEFAFKSLEGDPRYTALVKKLGFPT